jgi:hypothetical protein
MATNRATIKYGSQGDDVKEVQRLLNANGYSLDVDGVWGDQTEEAVRKYQKLNGLEVDGIVGTQTWGSLYGGNKNTTTPTTPPEPKSYSDIDLSKYDSGYQKSDDVKSAEDKSWLADQAVKNHGDFQYSDQATFDHIINKILNREKFSYDLNGDALYQQYKDKYTQQGKMAMQDAMGQAAAMTGGYGNSYAALVGNQAYQASLENLNDVIPELYQMAYDKYNQEGQDMYNQYSMLADDRNTEYGMWGDKYNQLVSDRDYYANAANNAYTKDYGEWSDQRDFDTNQYWTETEFGYGQDREQIADEQWQKSFDEGVKQFNEQQAMTREQWEYSKAQAAKAESGGSGGSGGSGTGDGDFQKAVYRRTTDTGNIIWDIGGKEVEVEVGVNPYTGTKNPDAKNGTFDNGYQPNNVNGKKLSKSGMTDVVNGVEQNVWQTDDGQLWIWDGTKNKYLKYEE